MFGPRRHPVLATAAVVGVSRHSAKNEAERQAEKQAQREWEIQREAEQRSREKAEAQAAREWEIQREAEQRNRQKAEEEVRIQRATEAALKAQAASYPPTAPNFVPSPSYAPQHVSAPGMQPAAAPVRDMKNTRYCPACGNGCEAMDKFCRACGPMQT